MYKFFKRTVAKSAAILAALSLAFVGFGVSIASATTDVVAAPYLTSFSPMSGPVGTMVTLTGTGFTGLDQVWVGEGKDTIFSVASDTEATVTIPADGTTGSIGIHNSGGWSFSSESFTVTSDVPASVTTNAATGVSSTDATLNGTNGPVDATRHSFWVSTSTFSTASPTLPAGVYSTVDLGTIAPSTTFSAALSSATDLPAVTADTTYYFAAWTKVGGTWYPGAVLQFTTADTEIPTTSTTGSISGTVGQGILAVTSITPIHTSATADGTYANGWSYLFNITVPTNEPNLSMKFANWFNSVASSTIPVAGNMKISSAQAASTAPVVITAANAYSSPALDMIGDTSTGTPGMQVQVLVQVAVPIGTVNGSYTTMYGVQTLP
ncbi:MAG: IPT/TIG domain-containing protein [Minisyncoccota bacterium]